MERKNEGQSRSGSPANNQRGAGAPATRQPVAWTKNEAERWRQDQGNHALDVQASQFGDYDWKLIRAVQNCWDSLLESRHFAGEQTGKVTIHFRLGSDGTISQVSETQSTVDSVLSLLCRMAIEHPAPYEPWPNEMRHTIGENYRELTFTSITTDMELVVMCCWE